MSPNPQENWCFMAAGAPLCQLADWSAWTQTCTNAVTGSVMESEGPSPYLTPKQGRSPWGK